MAKTANTIQPLDALEQDAVLRSRLSHSLAHRPLTTLRNRLGPVLKAAASSIEADAKDLTGSSDTAQLACLSLLPELQSQLLALRRTEISASRSTASQLAQYQEQLQRIQREERECKERISGLKRDLEGVRRRRREKVEFGRVVEGVEAWFKTNGPGGTEIEDSLSTLLSHLTTSFLYKPVSADEDTVMEAESSSQAQHRSPHSDTLSQLHSKLETMLTLAREVREIVGWKPGMGGAGVSVQSASTGTTTTETGSLDTSRSQFASGGLDPTAKPFEPSQAGANLAADSGVPMKRTRSGLAASTAVSRLSMENTSSEPEEGEEILLPAGSSISAATKRRRVLPGHDQSTPAASATPSIKGEEDDDEEEGSIAPAGGPGSASRSGNEAIRGGRTNTRQAAGGNGGGRQGPAGGLGARRGGGRQR